MPTVISSTLVDDLGHQLVGVLLMDGSRCQPPPWVGSGSCRGVRVGPATPVAAPVVGLEAGVGQSSVSARPALSAMRGSVSGGWW